ncbi:hypothetical protein [Parafrankia sp. EUN1f]|uniref:hypothetical protein n=1 Tax=Parafrankia sp. EUN1f TaxID=102897 RepID=UPI0001C44DB4|nr:hypothetical protein [Parafrankia sp. EUN1f]EFC84963.1 hypothetical protein FrEUN1fDRAFT_1875 [Parafrankia sp. EUN1f]
MSNSRNAHTSETGDTVVFGSLVLADLENRATRAYADHGDGYTASSVLHVLWMDHADESAREALNLVFAELERYHARARKAWHDLYNAWAVAAGLDPIPDEPDEVLGDELGTDYDFDPDST